MNSYMYAVVLILFVSLVESSSQVSTNRNIKGKKWAVLVAGSNYFENYRHQADVCHAYQLLKKGGLKDENIVVFMFDDIALHHNNPMPGKIINKPGGADVYKGVPKDYTGEHVTVSNLFAVILGNKSAVTGGSGKVVDSGPNDHIFIYYTDHGAAGVLGMPNETLYAIDLINVLKKKHRAKSYKSMVFYIEACESGSIFQGLLPNNLNIYATTAANATESSYAAYCPDEPIAARKFDVCLGDLYSISWLEDSDANNMNKETLEEQYKKVRDRTAKGVIGHPERSSHVLQFGSMKLRHHFMSTYIGGLHKHTSTSPSHFSSNLVDQRNARLLYLFSKFHRALNDPWHRIEARNKLVQEIHHRRRADHSILLLGEILFGKESMILKAVRPRGLPIVDDWDCFKAFVKHYEEQCGSLTSYSMKYTRAIANICNARISDKQMIEASTRACLQASADIEIKSIEDELDE